MASGLFTQGLADVESGAISLLSDTIKILLVTSAYTFNPATLVVDAGGASDILDAEISVSGYTGGWGGAGRKTLGSKTVTADLVNNRSVFDAADPSAWTTLAAGATIAAAVIVKEGGSNDTTSRPIAYLDLTDTPTNGQDFSVVFNGSGIFYFGDGGGSVNAASLQGVAIKSSLTTTDGYVLTYVGANSRLELLAPTGGGAPSSLLNFATNTNVASGTALTANTWTDVISNQSITVANSGSTVMVHVGGAITVGPNSNPAALASRLVIDSAGTPIKTFIGGTNCNAGSFGNVLAGATPIPVTGLSAGSHTVKVQIMAEQTATWYLRSSTLVQDGTSLEQLTMRVLEYLP